MSCGGEYFFNLSEPLCGCEILDMLARSVVVLILQYIGLSNSTHDS